MSKITDIDAWRLKQLHKVLEEEKEFGEWDVEEAFEGLYGIAIHVVVAKDRTDAGFLELREELDREGRDYTVVSVSPTKEFDL